MTVLLLSGQTATNFTMAIAECAYELRELNQKCHLSTNLIIYNSIVTKAMASRIAESLDNFLANFVSIKLLENR